MAERGIDIVREDQGEFFSWSGHPDHARGAFPVLSSMGQMSLYFSIWYRMSLLRKNIWTVRGISGFIR